MSGEEAGSIGEKIQKVLAAAGVCSRREAERLIREGAVRVNGRVLENVAERVDLSRDTIEVRGRKLAPPVAGPRVLALYKIKGYVTSAADPHHPNTVFDLLPAEERAHHWLYVGRLDRETEGLLLFTDSGELAHRLTHPSFKVSKEYLAEVEGIPTQAGLRRLEQGLTIEGRRMVIDRARPMERLESGRSVLQVELHQGEKRQVRRMFEALGHPVRELKRVRFGPIALGQMKPGKCRHLSPQEVSSLLRAVGLAED